VTLQVHKFVVNSKLSNDNDRFLAFLFAIHLVIFVNFDNLALICINDNCNNVNKYMYLHAS